MLTFWMTTLHNLTEQSHQEWSRDGPCFQMPTSMEEASTCEETPDGESQAQKIKITEINRKLNYCVFIYFFQRLLIMYEGNRTIFRNRLGDMIVGVGRMIVSPH
jgi:hypothetical protein